jgi:hypothetical protein
LKDQFLSMKEEIETILECDAEARQRLESAKASTESISQQALEEIEKIRAGQARRKVEFLRVERESILTEARLRAQEILDQADLYLERAARKKAVEWDKLLDHFVSRVTGK